jgi:ABC-type transport system substrate-binding protein
VANAKRITASIMGEPASFINRVNPTQISIPGVSVLEQLVNASLSELNADKRLQPLLAEGVPSVEHGTWQVFPDGRMETTWTMRPGARWHDGTPLTGEDFVFTAAVDQDREMPIAPRPAGYGWVDRVEAPDAQTVKVQMSGHDS